ncbi:hypothetical protein ERJ75_000255300 [Trypanosoma vivax]|uniref:Band 7 domain-containing protein n=1 Tax=Trypanosoma vivax (strain Y486) TaxID=1055687 RepID=G0U1Z4_TRYVY|nr:hypothetical protein TRVL_08324 [Trypanosoma vivax]KAH8618606.1 hypothetical protein ERJ75_000255300 [Trypanosoma vivax]CCC50295.1 conserved hypothetical protein [Trypanosoma vivax Y486]
MQAASPNAKSGIPLFTTAAVAVAAMALGVKLINRCLLRVPRDCVTIVYDTRRNTILSTSMEGADAARVVQQMSHFRPLMYIVSAFLYSNKNYVVVPFSSFFGTFTIPRTALDEERGGNVVNCTVEDVHVADGSVNIVFTLYYCIPVEQLERYLAAVGPVPPNESIATAIADVARVHGAQLSLGILLHEKKRETMFLQPFQEHLASRLISEVCVKLLCVTVNSVESMG